MTGPEPPSFTCPCCGAVSYGKADIKHGYCGACHAFTGDPELFALHMQEQCQARTRRAELIDRIMDGELPRYAEAFQRLADYPD